jgi:hypothetical protein
VRRALALPPDMTLTMTAAHRAETGGVEVYEVWPDGRVERVDWAAGPPP